jgi:hypothetical protein
MRLSILVDENTTTLEPPVVMENADRPIPDLSRLADEEHPETTEYLFIGALRQRLGGSTSCMRPE